MPNFTGDTTLTNVEANQSIKVTDGSLTILGDICSKASIILEYSQPSESSQICFGITIIGNKVISGGAEQHKLIVQGKVHAGVNIIGSATMKFCGDFSNSITVETQQGNITVAGNMGSNNTLKSLAGDVSAGNVGSYSILETLYGDVSAGKVAAYATLKTNCGNVSAISLDPRAIFTTLAGKYYLNGREEVNVRQNRSTDITNDINIPSFSGNLSFFSSAFIDRVEQGSTPSQTRNTHASANTSSVSNSMPTSLQSYIDGFKEGESFQDAFKRLNVDASNKYSFLNIFCLISQDIPNIPVSMDGRLYDWSSLKLQIEKNGYIDPVTRKTFTLEHVNPDRTTCDSLEGIIKKEEEEMHKANIATSSPIFKR